jgi:hypothetical protein
MLSIAPKITSTVALDPLPPPTYCFRFMLPLHTSQQGFLFHLNSSLAEHQSKPTPKTIQASHSHPDSLPNRAWWEGWYSASLPFHAWSHHKIICTLYMHWSAEVKVWMKTMQPRQSPSNADQESDLKTADLCCLKLLLWVWFWFSWGLLPCTPWIVLGSGGGGLVFQYFKEWQSTGVPKKMQGQRPLKENLICYLWATFVVWW